MQRRDFLKLGGLSTLGVTAPQVAAAGIRDVDTESVELDCRNMDAGRASIRAKMKAHIDEADEDGTPTQLLTAMRQLAGGQFVYQAFSELPLDAQVHPDVQDRMQDAASEIEQGLDDMRTALDRATPAELEAVDAIFRGSRTELEEAALDADQGYGRNGGSHHGRRRFMRLADMAIRDAERNGAVGAMRTYLTELDDINERKVQRVSPSEADIGRVARAKERWIREGVPKARFQDRSGEYRSKQTVGIVLIVLGIAITAIGIPFIICPCIGLPIILLGVILIIFGAKSLRKAQAIKMQMIDDMNKPSDDGADDTPDGG